MNESNPQSFAPAPGAIRDTDGETSIPGTKIAAVQVGQRIKVKGSSGENGTFQVLEIELKLPKPGASFEGVIRGVDAVSRTLDLLGRRFQAPADVTVLDLEERNAVFDDVAAGMVVKLRGTYSAAEGLRAHSIAIKETLAFNIEKMQGFVEHVDLEKGTIRANGFTLQTGPRTVFKGFR